MNNSPWPMVSLDTLLRRERRPVEVKPNEEYAEIGVYCFGKGIFHKSPRTGFEVGNKKLFRIEEGDFILQITFAWEGAVALASEAENGMYGSTRFPTFRVDEGRCYPQFLLNYFKTKLGRLQLVKISPGSAGRNRVLSLKRFPEVLIPLPPLTEQRRIVARIETLAAKVDAARTLREQAAAEAKALLSAQLEEIFENSWFRKRLSEIAGVNMGQSPPGETYNQMGVGLPLLNGPTEFTDKYPIPTQWTNQPTKVCNAGDLLICVRGNTTGRMNWADRQYCIGRGLAALTPETSQCLPEYLRYFLQHQAQIILETARGSTFPNLPGRDLKSFKVPLPPLPEQHRIVAHLDALHAKLAQVRQHQAATQSHLDALLPSILDQAFKGEL